jgi:hypothetical protein
MIDLSVGLSTSLEFVRGHDPAIVELDAFAEVRSMKVLFNIAHGLLWPAVCLSATLFAADIHSAEVCPQLVESRAGSVFNMSAFIRDNGSPEAALNTARAAVLKVSRGGGCGIFNNVAACEETLTLARVAIAALQACIASTANKNPQENGGAKAAKDAAND